MPCYVTTTSITGTLRHTRSISRTQSGSGRLRSSGLVRSKAECTREEANGAVRTLLDILLQSTFCQASQVRCARVECAPAHRAVPPLPEGFSKHDHLKSAPE